MSARTVIYLLNSRGVYVLLASMGLVIGLCASYEYQTILRVETHFVETPAEVQSATIQRQVTRGRRGRSSIQFRPEVTYSYKIDGQLRFGKDVAWYTPTFNSEYDAGQYLAALCGDGRTVCYFDPTDKNSAVLDRTVNRNVFSLLVTFSGAFVILGTVGLGAVMGLRAKAREHELYGDVYTGPVDPMHKIAGTEPAVLDETPTPKNDPLARSRALMKQFEEQRSEGRRTRVGQSS